MRKYIFVTLIVGFVVGVVFLSIFNWSLALTNTEDFCISCHSMKDNPYAEFKESIHHKNKSGVRATCSDCHVPKTFFAKIKRKIAASTEIYHTLIGTIDTKEKYETHRLKMALSVWQTMTENDSKACRNCHKADNMDLEEQNKSAIKKHIKAKEKGITCIKCHKGLAHEMPEDGEEEAEKRGL